MISPSPLQNVSRETLSRLDQYVALLLKWNAKINLIDRKTEADIWARHITDSVQLVQHIPTSVRSAIDYGSGGGLPGLVIAICRPDLALTCVERDQRKAIFLQEAKRELKLENLTVRNDDVASVEGSFDMVTARAFTNLTELLSYAVHHMHHESICLFPKGKTHATEIEEARRAWSFDLSDVPSNTDAAARILLIQNPHAL